MRHKDHREPIENKDTKNIKTEFQKDTKAVKDECNCNDKFKTHPCPIHFNQEGKGSKSAIITDANMVKEEIRQWVGYAYKCPNCNEISILDFMKFCGNCGTQVTIQSIKLTNFINELSKRGRWQ